MVGGGGQPRVGGEQQWREGAAGQVGWACLYLKSARFLSSLWGDIKGPLFTVRSGSLSRQWWRPQVSTGGRVVLSDLGCEGLPEATGGGQGGRLMRIKLEIRDDVTWSFHATDRRWGDPSSALCCLRRLK